MAPQLPLSFRSAVLNPEVGSMRALLLLCALGSARAQSLTVQTPEVSVYEGARLWSHFVGKYLPAPLPHTVFSNSDRLDSLMRAGNLYLSLADAIALALENNLDIEYHRYDRRQAETDQLRASAGQLLRFSGGGIRAGFSSASSGVLSGSGSLGGGGGGGAQSGILSGFSIQAAGSGIPNLEPLAFVSWQAAHQTRILTSDVGTGTNYLISSAHTADYGIQKSFLTGTQVTLDMSQQSLFQNAPANEYNPSLNGNLALSIHQPLLQGFGLATNRRAITIARNNLTVADLNFKTQVIATVKNVIDLYWDLVSLNDNLKAKQKALDIAEKLYQDNRKRLAIGAVAPIDIVQAEAGAETARLDLRQARAQLLQQELIIKSALTRGGVDSVTIMDAHIIPTDSIQVPESDAVQPIQDMVAEALANRPELKATAINMENTRINMKGVKNAMRPGLDVYINLQNNGLAGDPNTIPIPLASDGTPLFSRSTPNPYFIGNWGGVFSQVLGRDFPNYSVGFNLNIPLRNSAARADMIKNQLDYRQAEIDAKQAENSVRLNVVNARIALEQARAAYETAVKARQLQEQTFAGTQRKYQMGTATFTDLALLQRDVVTSQTAETNALNGYIKARNNLDMVLGRLLEVNHVDIQEAYQGKVRRSPGPLPVLDPSMKATAILTPQH
jgi:outer membrane protein TolC